MANLVTIGGVALPTPSSYVGNTATIVDSARNVSGKMVGTVIRDDVAKVSMTWAFISAQDWANILKLFDPRFGGSFTREVTFFNQSTASLETRTMYVSDRTSSGSFLLYNEQNAPYSSLIGLPRGYQNANLSLIEV